MPAMEASHPPVGEPPTTPIGPSSRSRRRGPRKGDIREQAILDTAEKLLAEKSIHEVSVDELAQGAELSRPTFYFYFESKFAVLQALVDRVVRETYEVASHWLASDDEPPEQAIRRSVEAIGAQWAEHGPLMRAAVETWGSVPEMGSYWEGNHGRLRRSRRGEDPARAPQRARAGRRPRAEGARDGADLDERALLLHSRDRSQALSVAGRDLRHAHRDLATGRARDRPPERSGEQVRGRAAAA